MEISREESACALALMKIISVMPWIIEIAEHGYDKDFVEKTITIEAIKIQERINMEKLQNGL